MSGYAFEEMIGNSGVKNRVLIHRLKTRNTTFKGDNEPGDFIIIIDSKPFIIEAKSTQNISFPLSMIQPSQIVGLRDTYEEGWNSGFLIEMRSHSYRVFYLGIDTLIDFYTEKNKSSLTLEELEEYGIEVGVAKKEKLDLLTLGGQYVRRKR